MKLDAATLRWQLRDLLRQVRRQRVWWAIQAPDLYGGYLDGPDSVMHQDA